MLGAAAPAELRLDRSKTWLWRRGAGPHLRGAVFVQRRVYRELDGANFLGDGAVGAPVTDRALDDLAQAGANLACWSGPAPFAETAPFNVDPLIEDHIARWLDRCLDRGLFTVLKFRSGPGRSAFAFHPDESWYPARLYDASIWRDREAQAAWTAMTLWSLCRFGGHPALAGVLAMDEPNGADLGYGGVWPAMAQNIARQSAEAGLDRAAPLLLSPDRWARLEEAQALKDSVGPRPVLITHDYSPWAYTHPGTHTATHPGGDAPARFDPRQAGPTPARALGPAGVLEFGALGGGVDLAAYLTHRIGAYEDAGLNWSVFRWTSGWQAYESREGRRDMSADPRALSVLRRAFSANIARPGAA